VTIGGSAGSGSAPLVAVVEPDDLRELHDLADSRRLDGRGLRRVLAEAEVGSGPVIVGEVLGDDAEEVPGVQDQEVIETLPPHGADQALDVRILPGWYPGGIPDRQSPLGDRDRR